MLAAIAFYFYFKMDNVLPPIEEHSIPSAIGYDIVEGSDGNVEYKIPISVYNYSASGETDTMLLFGIDKTITETREERQLMSNRRFILGLERVIFTSEAASRFGIKNMINVVFTNRTINDTAFIIVCKGTVKEILEYKIKGFPGSGDYAEGIIRHLKEVSFFSNNYKVMDTYVRLDAEGRNIVLPYMEIKGEAL